MIKYRLKGHESFILREGWMTKGLKAVSDNARVFAINNGADALGVGTNMAKSIRYWMRTSGFMKENSIHGSTLTELGNIIYEKDPYFEDDFSLWLAHVGIVRNFAQATTWNLFFNELDVSSFSRDELVNIMKNMIEEKTRSENVSARSVQDDCSAILNMYVDNNEVIDDPEDKKTSPFATLGLLHKNGHYYEKQRPSLERLSSSLLLYMIQDELRKEKSMLIDDLVEKENMPGKVLNLNRVMVNQLLDDLQEQGYLIINRTAGLDVIYPKSSLNSEEIVKVYFGMEGVE